MQGRNGEKKEEEFLNELQIPYFVWTSHTEGLKLFVEHMLHLQNVIDL